MGKDLRHPKLMFQAFHADWADQELRAIRDRNSGGRRSATPIRAFASPTGWLERIDETVAGEEEGRVRRKRRVDSDPAAPEDVC